MNKKRTYHKKNTPKTSKKNYVNKKVQITHSKKYTKKQKIENLLKISTKYTLEHTIT